MLVEARIVGRDVTILDDITLTITAGPPTLSSARTGQQDDAPARRHGSCPASGGRMTWGGRDIAAPTKGAIVFQRPTMLRRTAAANVHYALLPPKSPRAQRHGHTAALLALVGSTSLAIARHDGFPAANSNGSPSRAHLRDPAVLFLDEPSASLDPYATKAIEDIVHSVSARGVKVIMATHDLGQARRLAGDIVLLNRGRLVESTPAAEFFSAPRTDVARKFIAGELLV